LLRIQLRCRFLSQRERGEGLRWELLRIQWKQEVLSWLGMAAERGWGQVLIIQWRRGFLNYRPGRLFVFEVVMDFDQVHAGLTDDVVSAGVCGDAGEGVDGLTGGAGGFDSGFEAVLGHADFDGVEETGLLEPAVEETRGDAAVGHGLFEGTADI